VVVEGNHYFLADSINAELFDESSAHTFCAWKGEASYKTVVVDGERNPESGLVLPRAQGRRSGDQGPLRLLARRRGHGLRARPQRTE
jgi:hypothetical protein